MNTNLKQNNDSDCNFYNISFSPICVFIFLGIYSLPPPPPLHLQMFFVETKTLSYLLAGSRENFKFLGDLLNILGGPNFLFGRGLSQAIFSHKAIHCQSCKLKNSWWQNYLFHVCMLTILIFTCEFFVLFKYPLKLSKKCLLLFVLFDMSSE